jgi:hypothetical protein
MDADSPTSPNDQHLSLEEKRFTRHSRALSNLLARLAGGTQKTFSLCIRPDLRRFVRQRRMFLFKGIGDILKKEKAEDDVLVLGRVHVAAELVGGEPELCFEAEIRGGVVVGGGAGPRH